MTVTTTQTPTGVFATNDQLDYLRKLKTETSDGHPLLALALHRLAHKQGLIREVGTVGIDWQTGEFLADNTNEEGDSDGSTTG